MTFTVESDNLHRRVRRFARGEGTDDFDTLALEIARYQARRSPRYAKLVASRGSTLDAASSIVAVPSDAFRLARVAVHPESEDMARFETSGTTGSARGVHAFRSLETYRELALAYGEQALLGARRGPRVVVSLSPAPSVPQRSSLGFMAELFQARWDGRSLGGGPFAARAAERWLAGPGGIDVSGLELACLVAERRREPLLVLATAFALVALLDALGGRVIPAPSDSTIMMTGGFKGRSREVVRADLRRSVAQAFGVSEAHVVTEYGMTELTSQLYEGTLPGARLAGDSDVLLPPPWLRVEPVDPATLEPVAPGSVGIARFVDLGNVDSAVAVQTDDLVRNAGVGIELFGRRPGAPARGCSLALEALVG